MLKNEDKISKAFDAALVAKQLLQNNVPLSAFVTAAVEQAQRSQGNGRH